MADAAMMTDKHYGDLMYRLFSLHDGLPAGYGTEITFHRNPDDPDAYAMRFTVQVLTPEERELRKQPSPAAPEPQADPAPTPNA